MNHTSQPTGLPSISSSLLTRWLKRHESELVSRLGADVLGQIEAQPHEFLRTFSRQLPPHLHEDLVLIEQLNTDRCTAHMWHTCQDLGVPLEDGTSRADLVVHCLLANWGGLKWLRATREPRGAISFKHFRAKCDPEELKWMSIQTPCNNHRAALDSEMSSRGRGRVLGVHVDINFSGECIVIQRTAQPQSRVKVDPKTLQRSLIDFEEEYDDFLVYDYVSGQLRIHARDPRDAHVYREWAGPHLFGRVDLFCDPDPVEVFTLQPIIDQGRRILDCDGFSSLQSIQLAKLSFEDGFDRNGVRHLESTGDVLADLERRTEEIPKHARLVAATFRVTMKSDAEHLYHVELPNWTECDCIYCDVAVRRWMLARGILRTDESAKADDQRGFWPLLDSGLRSLRTWTEWRATCGENAEAITQLIQRTPDFVTRVPSPDPHAPRMRVVSRGELKTAVCDQGLSPERILSPAEYILYEIDPNRLSEGITTALGLKPTTRKPDALDDRLNIGNWCPAVGVHIPAVLVWGLDRNRFEVAVKRVVNDVRPRVLILTPTAELWSDELREWVQANGGYLVPLCDVVEVRDKKLVGNQVWPEFERRIRRSFGIDEVRVAKPKPRPKKRGDRLAKKEKIQEALSWMMMERMREIEKRLASGERPPCSLERMTQRQIAERADCTETDVSRVLNEEDEGKLGKLFKKLHDPEAMDQEYRKLKRGGLVPRLAL